MHYVLEGRVAFFDILNICSIWYHFPYINSNPSRMCAHEHIVINPLSSLLQALGTRVCHSLAVSFVPITLLRAQCIWAE